MQFGLQVFYLLAGRPILRRLIINLKRVKSIMSCFTHLLGMYLGMSLGMLLLAAVAREPRSREIFRVHGTSVPYHPPQHENLCD